MWKIMKKRMLCVMLVCSLLFTQTIWADETEKEVIAGENMTFWLPFMDVVLDDADGRLQYLKYLAAPENVVEHITGEEESKSVWEKNIYNLLDDAKGNYDDISIQGAGTTDILGMTLKKEVFETLWKCSLSKFAAKVEGDALEGVVNKFTDNVFKDDLSSFRKAVSENKKLEESFKKYKFWVDSIADGIEVYDILKSNDPDKALQVCLCISEMVVDAMDEVKWKGNVSAKLANKLLDVNNGNWNNLMRTQEYKAFVKEHQEEFNKAFVEATASGLAECLTDIPREMRQLGKAIIDTIMQKDDGLSFLDRLLGKTKPTSQVNVYKPNIYLYSENELEVSVVFKRKEFLTVSIPEYELGWDAIVHGSGLLTCQGDTYDFLFYESLASKALVQRDYGWIIEADNREEQLLQVLQQYGFNEKETADFLEFWMEMLVEDMDYVMYPQNTEAVDKQMPVVINPCPDEINRIWFAFECYDGQELEKPIVTEIVRDGFTVVEWGGFFLD